MNRSKIYSLEILRAIAYTAIFISHAYNCDAFIGSWAVSVFLVLSGFYSRPKTEQAKLAPFLTPMVEVEPTRYRHHGILSLSA